ncbi:alkaline protease 2 [Ceratobasidium sp. AG-Ba]|nr:alkaline protease 2 [Ceratobasidium sp. AG-Ba]
MSEHDQFPEGRVILGPNYTGLTDDDVVGHGTHVAGIIGGKDVGVATSGNVLIFAVKVIGGENSLGSTITGMEWAIAHAESVAKTAQVASIINMSLRFPPVNNINDPLELLVAEAVSSNIHVVVSAGNRNDLATSQIPARAPQALAVGASNIADERWEGSNYGPKVGIFAPGVTIMSAGIASPTALVAMTGTSMAAPVVSGIIAYLIQKEGNMSPEAMIARLLKLAAGGVGLSTTSLPPDTTKLLVHNGFPRFRD